LRTNPPSSLDDVGSIYIKHCYFEGNSAAKTNDDGNDGIGRDIGFYDENNIDKWDDFVSSSNKNYEEYFLHSLSRTKFTSGTRNPRLFYINDDPTVCTFFVIIFLFFYF
jgi:hypothetical protein